MVPRNAIYLVLSLKFTNLCHKKLLRRILLAKEFWSHTKSESKAFALQSFAESEWIFFQKKAAKNFGGFLR